MKSGTSPAVPEYGLSAEPPPEVAAILARIKAIDDRVSDLESRTADTNALNLLVFDGSRDKLLAAFVMATGAAACGLNVSMFFTFWATPALRKGGAQAGKKSLVERMFGWMLPGSLSSTKLSRMDMGGLGRRMMTAEMRKKQVADLDELIRQAASLGVRIQVCEMSMRLMGIRREELRDYPNLSFCGVATFVDEASRSNTTLFI